MYLVRRSNGWYFQRRVPQYFSKVSGLSILRRKLGPMPKRAAQRMATALAGHLETRFAAMSNLQSDKIDVDAFLREVEEFKLRLLDDTLSNEMQAAIAAIEVELTRAASDRALVETLTDTVRNLSIGIAAQGRVPIVLEASPTAPREGAFTADTLLSEALSRAVESRVASLIADRSDGVETHYCTTVRTAAKLWLGIAGDRRIEQYTALDVQEFVASLTKLPSNVHKKRVFDGLAYPQIIAKNQNLRYPHPTLSKKTIKTLVSEFGTLWRLVVAGLPTVGDITAARARIPRSARKSEVREGLTDEALNRWFAAAAQARDSAFYWIPLLAFLTGMRLSEIVFLQPGDIRDYSGRTVIDIRGPLIIRGKEVERQLKTEDSSPRVIALNKFLFECGFVKWAGEVKTDWLFPTLHRRAKDPADAAQKKMNTWMRNLGIHVPYRQTFHSLRHGCKAWIRPVVGDRTADLQAGHVPETVGERYGFRVLTPEEVDIVAAVALPERVDFSPYLQPRKGRF